MKLKNLLLAAVASFVPVFAQAATLLTIDLSVENQVTVTATDGRSAETTSGSDVTGIYFADFFADGIAGLNFFNQSTLISSNFSSFGGSATPGRLSRYRTDQGLNIYSYEAGFSHRLTAGEQAFQGSATWELSALGYASLLGGPDNGALFFPADSIDDTRFQTSIGEWERIATSPVPLPASVLLLGAGLAGLGAVRRRKG